MYSLGIASTRVDNDYGGGVADIMDDENREFHSPSDDDNDDLFPQDDAQAGQMQKSEPP